MNTLRVAADGRHLEADDGTPFFYLADTAWELFHRLDIDETRHYLKNRADKGFTVIQAVVLAELSGLNEPNSNGDIPLIDGSLQTPNESYFRHVDAVVNCAAELGLVVGMLPTWGRYWIDRSDSRPLITPDNAEAYGRFLGSRYRDAPLIWILGGDQNIENSNERRTIDTLALGLTHGDGGRHLKTFHPRGPGNSSKTLHDADWLDFNMIQSSHGSLDHDNGLMIELDRSLSPAKPTLDGEPRYESIPVGFYNSTCRTEVRFDDYDARQAAYWALLAGACGHTYGNNNVWQMWRPGLEPVIHANIPWRTALDHPGAFQMGHLKSLWVSRPWQLLEPDYRSVADGLAAGGAKIRAARSSDGSWGCVYSPRGEQFSLRMDMITDSSGPTRVRTAWFDPRYGTMSPLHTGDNSGIQTFSPPNTGRGRDWLLILDDESKDYPLL